MSLAMQVKLLRVIQERELLRVGGTNPVKVDVRFIAATNRNLHEAIEKGSFRRDLYFRLNVVSLFIPPLSERRDDIPMLCYYFLNKYATLMKKERGVALTNGNRLEVAHLPEDLKVISVRTFRKKEGKIPSLDEQERAYIQWVLKEIGGNKTAAAQILGIDRVSLWRKLKKYGLESD